MISRVFQNYGSFNFHFRASNVLNSFVLNISLEHGPLGTKCERHLHFVKIFIKVSFYAPTMQIPFLPSLSSPPPHFNKKKTLTKLSQILDRSKIQNGLRQKPEPFEWNKSKAKQISNSTTPKDIKGRILKWDQLYIIYIYIALEMVHLQTSFHALITRWTSS